MILMSANLWKAVPAADSHRVPRFEQGSVGDCGDKKRDPVAKGDVFSLDRNF